jgi:uncharacterized repeat protein (TIGR01451 family)
VTCVVPHLDAGGSAAADIVITEPTGDAAAGSVNDASISAAQLDPTPANDSGAATAPMPAPGAPAADLSVQDHESTARDALDGALTETITVVNHGPGAATGVDITDALDAAAQVTAVEAGAFTCTTRMPLQCHLDELAAGESRSFALVVRPLRPGHLIDAVTVSGNQLDPSYANDFAKAAATVTPLRTAAKVRIVPIEAVATPGHVVGFVLTVAATRRIPGVMPRVCVTIPRTLRVTSALGAVASRARLCFDLDALVSGKPISFRFSARVLAAHGASSLHVPATLTGTNFDPARARATVLLPRHPVACVSAVGPPARIAC